ncbi:MAG: hypothetical protein ABIW83_02875 [Allosphingosinicella sp.]
MSTTDTLCFGDNDGVTGVPTIDGLVDHDYLPFDPVDGFEHGYVGGSRLTFQGGGLPRVIYQGVRNSTDDSIVMGFFCRFDDQFDADDLIVLALRSDFASGPARLIAIYPNLAGVGVDAGAGAGPNQIKRDIIPPGTRIDFWEETAPNTWSPIPDPAGVVVKLRSWLPMRPNGAPNEVCWSVEVSWPRVSAGFTLNDDFGLYFNVVRVLQSAMIVQSAFPTTALDLMDAPGVNFTVPQWGHGLIPFWQVPKGSNLGVGVRFKNGMLGVGRRELGLGSPTLTGAIEGSMGTSDNEICAFVENNGETAANDIWAEFRFANWGLPPATFPAWDLAQGMGANPAPHRVGVGPFDPAFNLAAAASPATPVGGTIATPWLRTNVPTQYATHQHQCIWVQLTSANTVNFTQPAVRRNMDFDHFSEIVREAEVSGEGYPDPADGSDEHDFVIETFCRQINVSEIIGERVDPEALALVEGALAQGGGKEPSEKLTINVATGAQGTSFRNTAVLMWVAQGYRRSGKYMNIRGTSYEILDHRPGEFGIVARHEGISDPFHYAFAGPGLVQYAPGLYGLRVPHKKTTTIKVTLGAGAQGPAGDRSELPKAPWPRPRPFGTGHGGTGSDGDHGKPTPTGCLALLARLLRGLLGKRS